jgi:hypothetical protein
MAKTKQLPRAEWEESFARFTRERLRNEGPVAATVEVMSPTLGDQFEVSAVRLLGLAYDLKSNALEVELEDLEHLIFYPKEIWVLEGEPGFLATLEVVRQDGLKEIIYIRKSGSLVPYRAPEKKLDAGRA